MRKVSGDLHIVDFKTKQIIASLQPEDYFDDLRHWEIKDNVDILDFKLLEDSPFLDYIQQKNLILKETNPGVITPYVITSIEKDSETHNVTIYASGEWILLDKEVPLTPQEIKSWSAKQYLTFATIHTDWEVGFIEAIGNRSFKIEKPMSPLQFIQQIATLFDNIEIQYRIEIGTGKPRRFIDLVKKRGRETNKEVTLGKDLVGIKRIENSENIITALFPYYIGQDADGNDKLITIESVNNGSQYIVDDAAFQRWNVNGKHLFGFYTPESEKDELTPARLLTLAKTELKKRVSAIVTYEVNSVDISSVFGYEHEDVSEGDTIRIIDEGMTPTLYLEARAIAGDNSYKDKHQNKHTFGNYVEIVNQDEALRKLYQKMLSMINDKVSKEWFGALEEKANEATKKANEAVEESKSAKDLANATKDYMDQNMVDIIEQPTAPTNNLRDGKTLWIDSSDPENKVQKLWKDGQWQRVTPDTGPLKQSIKDVQKDIETTKTELSQKVQSVEGKAQEIAGQIVDVQNQVNSKVDQTWIDTQLKDKADKSGVYTKDEIKDGFIGKQVYETDKQGNVQKFQDINTSIGQTNEALTQKAEKSELKTISNNVVEVTKTVNETKQMAEGTKESLSQVTSKLDNAKVAERNVITNSNFGTGDATGWAIWDKQSGNGAVEQAADIPEFAYCGKLTRTNNIADLWFMRDIKVTPGQYIISAFFKSSNLTMAIGVRDGSTSPTYKIVELPKDLSDGKWHHFKLEVEFTTSEARVYFGTRKNKETTGEMFITGTKLAEGTVFSTWSPAPEDQLTNSEFTKKAVEIEKNINGVTTSVSNIQNEQGKLTERVTKSEQTADGFKTSIESLTKKDTEISNKLNTVESTVEGTKKTISDVQQTTNDLKKTTTEIEEKAGKITEKLTSLETREVNVRNYVINSDFSNGTNSWIGITNATLFKFVDVNISEAPAIKKGLQITSNKAFILQQLPVDVFKKKKGIASCYINVSSFTPGPDYPRLYMRFTYDQNGTDKQYYAILKQQEVTNGWVRISIPFDTTGYTGELKEVRVNIATADTTTIDATFTGIMVTFGDLIESWNLAPEDGVTQGTFQSKTTEIEKSVDGVKTTVTNVKKDQDTMQTTLNQVKQTADSNSQTITSLSQTQGKHGEIIQQNTSDITQLNNQIKSKVSDTQMQEYVGTIGSENLYRNSAFEHREIDKDGNILSRQGSYEKWTNGGSGSGRTITVDTARQHDGYNSVCLTGTGLTSNGHFNIYQQMPISSASGFYTLSTWVYTDNMDTLDQGAYIEMIFYNGSTRVTSKLQEAKTLLSAGVWTFISVSFEAPANVTSIRGSVSLRRNGNLWVSQPMLQKGKSPSTFMENPKDYANYDQLVGELAKKVATSDFNSKVTQMETTINQQSNRIDLKAEKNDVYTKLDSDGRYGSKAIVEQHTAQLSLMSDEINLRVKNGDIASTINQTAQSVLIQAGKIYLDGYIEAKHLKANKLTGVTIETEPQVFANAKLHLNRQNLTIIHGNVNRGYLGFVDRTDAYYQPMIQIGGAYVKNSSASVSGSLITSVIEDASGNAVLGVIGMAKSMSGNDISYYNSLTFNPLDKTLKIASDSDSEYKVTDGNIDIKANSSRSIAGFANIEATRTVTLTSNSGRINFNQSSGSNRASIEFSSTYYTDFNLGGIKLRYSSHPDDNGKGLHLVEGGGLGNMKLNILRADGNISSQGTVYAVAFQPTSSRKIKTNFADLPFSALEKVNSVNIKQYNFIKDVEEYKEGFRDKVETYYGMIAEDVDQVFASPERDSVNLYNIASISMQAIQEVDWKVNNLQFDIGMLKQELEAEKNEKRSIQFQLDEVKSLVVRQEDRIAKLEELLLQQLIDKKPEQP
ncbi:phage tail spike protein (plasmid) [Bacillus tropicus]|uniref:Phage tail spike protein n=1 Tax=Bacillus tropicus TaxID=2026188 RepID=A0ABD7ZZG9_9BACI|nr:phage tail spike protein [Bacillus tropicus]WMY18283.1 phage tail spike protein [Bacillus tropicus]